MQNFIDLYYPWIKAFHIMFVTFWMAGLFYLPRLFVYHVDAKPGSDLDRTLITMERRLLRGIILPSMIITFLLGAMLLFVPGLVDFSDGWLHVKLFCVLLLVLYHAYISRLRKKFLSHENTHTGKFYRILNEVPPLLFVIIVLMVVLKPA